MERKQRFELFLARLAEASPASSIAEAFELIASTLNSVEDRYSGVPMKPSNYRNDGRLYPPQRDSLRAVADRADLVRYRARQHNVWIAENGAIRIETVASPGNAPRTCLSKPSADGSNVEF